VANKAYSYNELTTPLVSKFRKRMQNQLEKVAKVLIDGLKANEVKDFAHQGVVVDRRTYIDHGTRIRAGIEIARLGGAEPVKRTEIGGIDGKDITVIVKHYSEKKKGGKTGGD